jgi:hypothetical protein
VGAAADVLAAADAVYMCRWMAQQGNPSGRRSDDAAVCQGMHRTSQHISPWRVQCGER